MLTENQSGVLNSSRLQIRFKHSHPTMQCIFVVDKVIDFCVGDNSTCNVIMVDASKAFDHVCCSKHFEILMGRHVSPHNLITY